MKARDNRALRISLAVALFLLLWGGVGALGPWVYWTDHMPIWNHEAVRDLHSFLTLRRLSFIISGGCLATAVWVAIRRGVSFRRYISLTGIVSLVANLCVLLFFPEASPLHLLYREFPMTNYAKGFKPTDFLSISVGMTKADVEQKIGFGGVSFWAGAPTRESSTWMYSGPGGENHWRYWLRFDDQGKITKVDVEYWWD